MVTIDYRITPQDRNEAKAALSQVAWPNRPIEVPSPVSQALLRLGLCVGLGSLTFYLLKRNGIDLMDIGSDYAKRNPAIAGWTLGIVAAIVVVRVLVRVGMNLHTRSIRSRITFSAGGVLDEAPADEQPRRSAEKRNWTDFSGWVETQGLFVLRMHQVDGRAQAMYFPKRLFAPDQAEYLRQLLKQYIPYPEQ